MIPLLSRIYLDLEFGRGEFRIAYLDRLRDELVYLPLGEVHPEEGSHYCFEVLDEDGVVHSIPFHRVKEVWKDDMLIWRREH